MDPADVKRVFNVVLEKLEVLTTRIEASETAFERERPRFREAAELLRGQQEELFADVRRQETELSASVSARLSELNSNIETVKAAAEEARALVQNVQTAALAATHKALSEQRAEFDTHLEQQRAAFAEERAMMQGAIDASVRDAVQHLLREAVAPLVPDLSGLSCAQAKAVGVTALQASRDYSLPEMRKAGYTCLEARVARFSLREIKAAGYTLQEAKAAGYTVQEAKAAGYTAQEIKTAGYTVQEAKAAGFSAQEIKTAGYWRYPDLRATS